MFVHASRERKKMIWKQNLNFQASGELSGGFTSLVDPKKNKYEEASQIIIHLLMAASAGDETALKR